MRNFKNFISNLAKIADFSLKENSIFLGLMLGIVAFVVNVIIGYLLYFAFELDYIGSATKLASSNIFFIFFVILVAPFLEEVFFRGHLQSRISNYFSSDIKGIVVTNVIWCSMHMISGIQAPILLFIPGLIFGWLQFRTNSVWASIIPHTVMNILVTILLVFLASEYQY